MEHSVGIAIFIIVCVLIHLAFIARAILRPHREPASRLAWVLAMVAMPFVGIVAYIFLGETSIGKERKEREKRIIAALPVVAEAPGMDAPEFAPWFPDQYAVPFRTGQSVNGFLPVGGNHAKLMADSNAAIDSIVADIDVAIDTVHLAFYIWLTDHNGMKVVEALKRAAARGVTCRAMADSLGSRDLIASKHWQDMKGAGVHVAAALRIGNPFLRALNGRIDLRNHRKIVVIDNYITYCGSQNCADPEFLVKAKYAPWVDILVRFEGPVARQNQYLFTSDWMLAVNEDLSAYLKAPMREGTAGFTAQAHGTGPTVRVSAMSEMFSTVIAMAREEIFITTPYFVPDDVIITALTACAFRGVKTTIIFPMRNDSGIVGATSRSYYAALLGAGVQVYEYKPGLLHAKTITVDGNLTLLGSANMDRRSLELNYENNILLYDIALTQDIHARQKTWLDSCRPVTPEMVQAWSLWRRLWNNAVAMMGPVL